MTRLRSPTVLVDHAAKFLPLLRWRVKCHDDLIAGVGRPLVVDAHVIRELQDCRHTEKVMEPGWMEQRRLHQPDAG